jgi:molecular chaperone DnaJ
MKMQTDFSRSLCFLSFASALAMMKDYYAILEIKPTATPQEIRKSFRRLALKYHPDKNPHDKYAEAGFKEIAEAYEILSDAQQREEYNYRRWYYRSTGKDFTYQPVTANGILNECNKLSAYVGDHDIFRIEYDALSHHIRNLLSEANTGILQQFNDAEVNRQVVDAIIKSCKPLPWSYIGPVADLLHKIAGTDDVMLKKISDYVIHKKLSGYWEKYKGLATVIIVALICLIIYKSR